MNHEDRLKLAKRLRTSVITLRNHRDKLERVYDRFVDLHIADLEKTILELERE